jgi:hypothetical protein
MSPASKPQGLAGRLGVFIGRRKAVRGPLLCLLAIQLSVNLSLHAVPVLDAYVNIAGMGANYRADSSYVGILTYKDDNFSYAAWAAQAQQGHMLMSDLYTTEPHISAMLNPYFLTVGWLAHLLGTYPLLVMTILGMMALPILGVLVDSVAAELRLNDTGRFLAVLFTLFATGPAVLLQQLGVLLKALGLKAGLPQGIDASYFDLFPATMVSFPYQAASTALTAAVLLLVLKAWRQPSTGRIAWAALVTGLLILVRPYQVAVMGLLLPASLIARGLLALQPGATDRATPRFRDLLAAAVILAPVGLYVIWMSRLPVWHDISLGYQRIAFTPWQMAAGFSLFWLGSAVGAWRAWRHRRWDIAILAAWFAMSVAATLLLGKAASKFDDAAVIAYAVLSAYGLEPILAAGARRNHPAATPVIACVAVCIATTIIDLATITHSVTPEVDTQVLVAAARLRSVSSSAPPLVLADCAQSIALPAFAGLRVYAGHWTMTLDNERKCQELADAGLSPDDTHAARPENLQALIDRTHARYLLLRIGSPADQFAAGWPGSRAVWSGTRWRLLALR